MLNLRYWHVTGTLLIHHPPTLATQGYFSFGLPIYIYLKLGWQYKHILAKLPEAARSNKGGSRGGFKGGSKEGPAASVGVKGAPPSSVPPDGPSPGPSLMPPSGPPVRPASAGGNDAMGHNPLFKHKQPTGDDGGGKGEEAQAEAKQMKRLRQHWQFLYKDFRLPRECSGMRMKQHTSDIPAFSRVIIDPPSPPLNRVRLVGSG